MSIMDLDRADRFVLESKLVHAIARTMYLFDHPEDHSEYGSVQAVMVRQEYHTNALFHDKVTTLHNAVLDVLYDDHT